MVTITPSDNIIRRIGNIKQRIAKYKRESRPAEWITYCHTQIKNLETIGNEIAPTDVIPPGFPKAQATKAPIVRDRSKVADAPKIIKTTGPIYSEPVVDLEATTKAVTEWLKNPVGAPPCIMSERTLDLKATAKKATADLVANLHALGVSDDDISDVFADYVYAEEAEEEEVVEPVPPPPPAPKPVRKVAKKTA